MFTFIYKDNALGVFNKSIFDLKLPLSPTQHEFLTLNKYQLNSQTKSEPKIYLTFMKKLKSHYYDKG